MNPWSFRDYLSLGKVCQVTERFSQAAGAYTKVCELEPDNSEAYINAARCYYEIKDYNNVLVYGEIARKFDPNASDVQRMLGDIYELRKDHQQAIALYKMALETDSDNPKIMTSLAVVYLRTNRNQEAKELLTSAIQIKPDNSAAYQYLGYCYLRLREQTIESHRSELTADSNAPLIEQTVRGYLNDAIQSYSKAIEINDKDWEAYRGLGVAYMLRALDNRDDALKAKAIEQWRASLDIKPDQPRREKLLELMRKYSN
jgi:tetratricopeptide (TPR) repeat protein